MGRVDLLRVAWLIACGAIVTVAQTVVKRRNGRAALLLTLAGAAQGAFFLWNAYGPERLAIRFLSPLFMVGAAGTAICALLALADGLNPPRVRPLPAPLENARNARSSPVALVVGSISALVIIAESLRAYRGFHLPVGAEDDLGLPIELHMAGAVAAVVALVGAYVLSRRGNHAIWILERRPDLVVWVYVSKQNLLRRLTGTVAAPWSAVIGLATGTRVRLPAPDEHGAQLLAASVAALCPTATTGDSAEASATFRRDPTSLKRSPTSVS